MGNHLYNGCLLYIAFRARMILDSYTIRINASACPIFNADFDDGDEMNILCASSHASKVEWKTLLAVNKCILSLMDSMSSIYIYTCNT
jgi:DNA-directed RNA polymerase beta' subunit